MPIVSLCALRNSKGNRRWAKTSPATAREVAASKIIKPSRTVKAIASMTNLFLPLLFLVLRYQGRNHPSFVKHLHLWRKWFFAGSYSRAAEKGHLLGNWASDIAFARTPVVPRLYESRSLGRIGGGRRLALLSSSGTVDGFGSGISRVPFGTPLLASHVPSECLLSSEGVAPKARLRVSALRSIMFVSVGHATL